MNDKSFKEMEGMEDIISGAGAKFEFVFANAPYAASMGGTKSRLWIKDPPRKDTPTSDRYFDQLTLDTIDEVVRDEGPFYGILGYSQGTVAALSYLSYAPPDTFALGATFCPYLPTTHLGVTGRIVETAPYDLPMYIYMSKNDFIITNCMTNEYATQFSSVTRATNEGGLHAPPTRGESGYASLLDFLVANHSDGSYSPPSPEPFELPDATCESSISVLLRLTWFYLLLLLLLILMCCICICKCCCSTTKKKGGNMASVTQGEEATPQVIPNAVMVQQPMMMQQPGQMQQQMMVQPTIVQPMKI